ncbi:beta-1,6-galactanase [Cercophora newfieldiana]|uniref:Beta-1,6-galactanase n=1 Tax=Cercophora newfieldiana TaxID=92897 RepID=A0AA40CT35_9PEZI|nr:beta-1,6-galactanase [Cercophora newfieldiana]
MLHRRQQRNATSWPYGPLRTRGRDIVNSRGETITFAGVTWPLSGETMIPEGLEYAAADDILTHVASVGFNFIRMPYAIQMVDEIYARNGTDIPLERALITTLGAANGTRVLDAILARNSIWTRSTPRFKIWNDIARLAARKNILIHPDTHVGKAQSCCSHTDGNAWFEDTNLPVANWQRALSYVADWAKNHTNIVSMSLLSTPRESYLRPALEYNWKTFVGNMTSGAETIHSANPDLLITWSGLQFGQDLSALTSRKNILTAPCYRCAAIRDGARRPPEYFTLSNQTWADKIVWELHLRADSEDLDTGTCRVIEAGLYRNGFNALGIQPPAACNVTSDCPAAAKLTPVILSEFGHAQDPTLDTDVVTGCLRILTERYRVSWAMWSLAGSWRVKDGAQGVDDRWGLVNGNWSGWRYEKGVETFWKPWVAGMGVSKP